MTGEHFQGDLPFTNSKNARDVQSTVQSTKRRRRPYQGMRHWRSGPRPERGLSPDFQALYQAGWTQRTLAPACGCSASTLYRHQHQNWRDLPRDAVRILLKRVIENTIHDLKGKGETDLAAVLEAALRE